MSTIFGLKYIFFKKTVKVAKMREVCYTEPMALISFREYRGKRVCVAVSGGVDSVSLLHTFFVGAKENGITLSAVTCEHGIRGESSLRDLNFVEDLCKNYGIPLYIYRQDVPKTATEEKIGLEEAGRKFRYESFHDILKKGLADVVVTAHHFDDFIETVLFRLARGTSLAGLNVFPERAGIARPFMNVPRRDILKYAEENSLQYVEDESNADTAYSRNLLRHEILPVLERGIPGAGENIARFARRAVRDDEVLEELARQAVGEGTSVPVELSEPIFTRACVLSLKRLGVLYDYGSAHLDALWNLRTLQSGKSVSLPQGLTAAREYDKIVFYRDCPEEQTEYAFSEGEFRFQSGTAEITEKFCDGALRADFGSFPRGCVLRTRREGDVITPYRSGKKTLKKFLTERKISARRGRTLPLIACGSEILAVFGVEISDAVKVTERTEKVCSLIWKEIQGDKV